MRFEWDEEKNEVNQRRHDGLDFETASRIFEDPNLILRKERIDERTGEQRWQAMGAAKGLKKRQCWSSSCMFTGAKMAKKSSALSRPEKLISVSAESIFKRPLTETQKATLERIRMRQEAGDDSRIDYSEIPELTEEQWAIAIRPNRAREYVGVRLDWDVLAWRRNTAQATRRASIRFCEPLWSSKKLGSGDRVRLGLMRHRVQCCAEWVRRSFGLLALA